MCHILLPLIVLFLTGEANEIIFLWIAHEHNLFLLKKIMSTTEERLDKIKNIFLKNLHSKLISNINIILFYIGNLQFSLNVRNLVEPKHS